LPGVMTNGVVKPPGFVRFAAGIEIYEEVVFRNTQYAPVSADVYPDVAGNVSVLNPELLM